MSSIYQLKYDNYLRYSGSEPIHIKNQQHNKSDNLQQPTQTHSSSNKSIISASKKYTIPFFSKNNLVKSDSKNSNKISGSFQKDNQNSNGVGTTAAMKNLKRKLLASSDSDFLSIIRNNSEKLRKNIATNCKSNNNLIYALSDSDFYINIDNNSKFCCYKNQNSNINFVCKNHQAIMSKSDIIKLLMNSKNIDYKNLIEKDNGVVCPKELKELSPVSPNTKADKPDILVDLLDRDTDRRFFQESIEHSEVTKTKSDDNVLARNEYTPIDDPVSNSCADMVDFCSIFQAPLIDTTPPLPPCIVTEEFQDAQKKSDAIYSVSISNNDLESPWNKIKLNDIEQKSENTLNPLTINCQVLSDASTISLDLVTIPKCGNELDMKNLTIKTSTPTSPSVPCKENGKDELRSPGPDVIETNKTTNGILTTSKIARSPTQDGDFNSGLVHRKRQSSTVTYNVNVINFQADPSIDDDNYNNVGPGYGARSNSSTSE